MTLQTSFFNKGIYKSAVKRYIWGSVLYFIILFISTGLNILTSVNLDRVDKLTETQITSYANLPLILRSGYLAFPIIMAIFVPTITALLIFRYVHSKKSAIFTHSIPVTKKANYFSSLLASITLMFVPVILNGIILAIISLSGYGIYFGVADALTWTGINLFALFIMFSVSAISSMLTGNSFAMVIINILIHSFLIIIVGGFSLVSEAFLYGYTESNAIFERLINNNFACISFSLGTANHYREGFTATSYFKFTIISVVIYFVSFLLYKNRKLENAEDVAGFKCLNHIFKYLVTFLATLGAFAIFASYINESLSFFTIVLLIVATVSYFACEMILKKTFNVFRSYKGLIGFGIGFMLIICLFSMTSFFGFESFVPDKSDIKTASVFTYYYSDSEPVSDDSEIIDLTIKTHNELLSPEKIYKIIPNYYNNKTRIHIRYELTNGKKITRAYVIPTSESRKIMTEFYKNDDYKIKSEKIFIDPKSLISMSVHPINAEYYKEGENGNIRSKEQMTEFLSMLQKDVLSLSYDELHPEFVYEEKNDEDIKAYKNSRLYSVEIRFEAEAIEREPVTMTYSETARVYSRGVYIELLPSYVNSLNWIKENVYAK